MAQGSRTVRDLVPATAATVTLGLAVALFVGGTTGGIRPPSTSTHDVALVADGASPGAALSADPERAPVSVRVRPARPRSLAVVVGPLGIDGAFAGVVPPDDDAAIVRGLTIMRDQGSAPAIPSATLAMAASPGVVAAPMPAPAAEWDRPGRGGRRSDGVMRIASASGDRDGHSHDRRKDVGRDVGRDKAKDGGGGGGGGGKDRTDRTDPGPTTRHDRRR